MSRDPDIHELLWDTQLCCTYRFYSSVSINPMFKRQCLRVNVYALLFTLHCLPICVYASVFSNLSL
ncbi:hypothetical protein A9A89_0722 [Bifidobacterium psychraerophilum DSM 22366]|nr:hypothetical protein A9A89_0722 [Bifidobacterium psychraerophilum DSM 22366]